MKRYTWGQLLLEALSSPIYFIQFLRLPRTYSNLDEWLEIDKIKSEIVAKIIGCKSVDSLNNQQAENMQYRKQFTNSFGEWMRLIKQPEHQNAIRAISGKYAQKRMCHRQYRGEGAGVWCYCR